MNPDDQPIASDNPASTDRPPRISTIRRQEAVILSLLQHTSIEKAARAAGVHPTTIRRYFKDPKFRRKWEDEQDAYRQHALGRLQCGAQAAVATIFRVMSDQDAPAGARLNAAKYVLESGKQLNRPVPASGAEDNRQGPPMLLGEELNAARDRLAKHREQERNRNTSTVDPTSESASKL